MNALSDQWFSDILSYSTNGKGMLSITADIANLVTTWNIKTGMCFLFLPHTSASITLCESYDHHSRTDVENYFERAIPEGQPWYQHTYEGPDDSPSHIRTTLSQSSICIPIDNSQLSLGTWQGIYLFEHRRKPHRRKLLVRALKVM
jgi:secondary thiamine-phosphate synthase enzyme